MNATPPTSRLRFRWSWRPYQARLLSTVDAHLRDHRLHVVAAPGAGKTTLGIEVFRRLGRPALVLTPTLTIRAQWLRRLRDFVPEDEAEPAEWIASWTSRDIARPAFFTVATYQSVLSKTRADRAAGRRGAGEAEEAESDALAASSLYAEVSPAEGPTADDVRTLADTLRAAGVGTLILDEAHHLKRAWWRALDELVGSLEGVRLVSLTGTPPYDSTGTEWRRYEELCGPIDDEISVPELVRAGTLCPHQDFVLAVSPRPDETARVRGHDDAVAGTLSELLGDAVFQGEVDAHPWVSTVEPDLDAVLGDPELAVALLVYLRASGAGLPPALLEALTLRSGELPRLDRGWWARLLSAYLHGTTFAADEAYRRALAGRLRERGLLWRRSLRIVASSPVERSLALSSAKIDACVRIEAVERAVRGRDLRQVVLTDFIRAEGLDAEPTGDPDLGALPVFDALVRARQGIDPSADLGRSGDLGDVALLSGRLSIVHESRVEELRRALAPSVTARFSAAPHRPDWLRVEGVGSGALVAAYTRLLAAGTLRVVVGTRALLGEGWDAPVVNSLVLASFVGAFVSTNQMRGRAIRTDPRVPDKVASVWHLVAADLETTAGFLDLDDLRERFHTFVGLTADGDGIESGFERLKLPPLHDERDLDPFNEVSLRRLSALEVVASGWDRAIERSGSGQVIPTVSFQRPPTLRPLHLTRTLRYVLYEVGLAGTVAMLEVGRRLVGGTPGSGFGWAILAGGAVPMALLAPRLLSAARLAVLHAPIDGSVAQIGRALLEALTETGLIEGAGQRVRVDRRADGSIHVALEGGSFHDQSLFADSIGELLGPVANPRYLITRPVTGLFGRRVDHHAVPHALGAKKERAEALLAAWSRHVGPGELVYTRREGGRTRLLAARGRSFSNQFVDPVERLDRWQ